jgi:hypothetical protein
MMLSESYAIRPTDDADPHPAGPEARQLDIQPNALAEAIIRYLQWQQRSIELREARRKRNTDLKSAA